MQNIIGEAEVSLESPRNRDISAFSKPQSAGFTKETSVLPCFASEAKQPYHKIISIWQANLDFLTIEVVVVVLVEFLANFGSELD